MPISTIAIAISTLFGDALAAFFSLNLGQGNSEKAARGVGTAVIASGVVSVLYTVLAFVSNNLLTQYGALSPYGPDIPLTTFSLCMGVCICTILDAKEGFDGNPSDHSRHRQRIAAAPHPGRAAAFIDYLLP